MHAAEKAGEDDRVPCLVPGWEQRGAGLTPEEGFLITRIDGVTSWSVLRRMGGFAPEDADRWLERWLSDGLVEVESPRATPEPPPARSVVPAPSEDAAIIDRALELDVELQRRILDFEKRLECPYYEILGVERDAGEREIKRTYFKLSRDFHPDRYFGREIGPFAPRLDRIFKKVALAYELLMDPATRAEVDRTFDTAPPEPLSTEPGAPPRKFTKREWLARMRRQFKIPEKVMAERRFKARQFADAARVAKHQSSWNEAASCIRLAIAFDPWSDEFKESFAEVQVEVNKLRATELLEKASGAWDAQSAAEALRLYEEALTYRPSDPEVLDRAAQLAVQVEDFERAREYAEGACELEPERAAYQLTLGQTLRRMGLRDRACKVLELARKLDPENSKIQEELARARRRGGPNGGRR